MSEDKPTISADDFPSTGNWTRDQLKLAFHFYCQTPFGKLDSRNKGVIKLAALIGRTPGALAMKLVNFASLDPEIIVSGRVGLANASQLDREIWDEFHADWERLAIECEGIRNQLQNQHGLVEAESDDVSEDDLIENDIVADYSGETRQAFVQLRVRQQFFRRAVLSSYRSRCCISGVSDARLLVASHIVPWRMDKTNRLNPGNGLCLSAIHDKAFDRGLITFSDDLRVLVSPELLGGADAFVDQVFRPIDGQKIARPERFAPNLAFIRRHRSEIYKGV